MDLIGCRVTIMQNRNTNLNDIYMSDRLQAQLQQIDQYAMTCVVAPMGYGKTTVVNWFWVNAAKRPVHGWFASVFTPTVWQSSGGMHSQPLHMRALISCANMNCRRIFKAPCW